MVWYYIQHFPAQKGFSNKDLLSKCDQIRRKLRLWSHLLKKPLKENFIFCAVFPSLLTVLLFSFCKVCFILICSYFFVFVSQVQIWFLYPRGGVLVRICSLTESPIAPKLQGTEVLSWKEILISNGKKRFIPPAEFIF